MEFLIIFCHRHHVICVFPSERSLDLSKLSPQGIEWQEGRLCKEEKTFCFKHQGKCKIGQKEVLSENKSVKVQVILR